MIKRVRVEKYECEKCGVVVKKTDLFCYKCGNDLALEVKYLEVDVFTVRSNTNINK